ncbi:MAG: response regulator transcription factor [Nitrospirae bacterium]|nr:response regulator transcription factor [Nitrospirota bacterium]MDA8339229.1 response regulator transcription factor [Nitrospiraceae bacterium]
MSKIKVLIADDHVLVREGIAAFLKTCDDIEVVAEASDGIEAIEKTGRLHPDVVVMDINMPRLGGYEATIEMKKINPDTGKRPHCSFKGH